MGVGAGLSMYVVVVQKFTFAISSPDEFLYLLPLMVRAGQVEGPLQLTVGPQIFSAFPGPQIYTLTTGASHTVRLDSPSPDVMLHRQRISRPAT